MIEVPRQNVTQPTPVAATVGGQGARVPTPRALIVKFGAIGDVVMAIPAAASLYASGWAIDWVASELVAPVLRLYPWIHVIAIDEPRLLRGTLAQRLNTTVQLSKTLRARARQNGRYELAATLYYDQRYSLLTSLVPASRRVKLSRTDRRTQLLEGRHHTDEYARILSGRLDEVTPFQLAPIPVPQLPMPVRPTQGNRPRVVLVPAGARNVLRDDALRRWPIEHYVTLAGELLQQGCEVLLAGGPDDRWASAHFAALTGAGPESFADLIGTLSLAETLALMDSALVTVTHDTGPLHLAGITSTAIVTIFGPTDPHGRLPQRSNAVAFWGGAGFACRPCYDGREYAPCSKNDCMAQVTPTTVLEATWELIRARAEGRTLAPRIAYPQPAPFVQIGVRSV